MVRSCDIHCDIDFETPGKAHGSFFVPHSGNAQPFGFRGPIAVLNGTPGPTLTLVGGVHGDEYQGPIVVSRLFHELDPDRIKGRIIFLPALNTPAFEAAARCSPLDDGNMNRAFKTARTESPTDAIAGWFEEVILPLSDAVIDYHAGGKASVFAPVSMVNCGEGEETANLELTKAFGLPLIWKLGPLNSPTSLNAAASRAGVPMMACELGGAGGSDTWTNDLAYSGAMGVLHHLGMLSAKMDRAEPDFVFAELPDHDHIIRAPKGGVFEPMVEPGQRVTIGETLGVIRDILDLGQPPVEVTSGVSGILAMRLWRSPAQLGERVSMILRPV